jgi:predicted transcriptional regulator
MQKNYDETVKKYEEKLTSLKEEIQTDMAISIERINVEKENAEQKYDQKRKALKELESQTIKQINQIEREKAVLQEKIINIESKKTDQHDQYEEEIKKLNE